MSKSLRWAALPAILSAAALLAADPPAEPAKKPPHERMLKGEDLKKAEALQKKVTELEAAGKIEEAAKAAEELLAWRTQRQGEDHWEVIDARMRLADLRQPRTAEERQRLAMALEQTEKAVHFFQQGKYAEAEPLYRRALAICQKTLGEHHPDTAQSYNNVAANLSAQGRHAEAEPLVRRALAIRQKALGEDHPDTAASYNSVAFNLHAKGRHAEAEPLLRKALATRQKALGEDHPHTATSCNNVAVNLHKQGRHAEAEPLLRKALATQQKARGEDHPHTATIYNSVAANLHEQGKFAEAEPLVRQGLAIRRKVLGEDHPDTAASYNRVAVNLDAQGRFAEAQPLARRALAIRRKALGEDHPDTAASYEILAGNLHAEGKYAEAEPLLRKALATRRRALGEDHPQTAASYNNVAGNLHAEGKYAEAEPLVRRALAIRRKALGEDHPDTADSYNNVAGNLHEQGKFAEAEPLLRKALATRQKARGEDHPHTAASYHHVALNLKAQGKHAEAEPLIRKALATRRRAFGEDHPDTTRSYNSLAAYLKAQGKHDEAQAILVAGIRSYEASRQATTSGLDRAAIDIFNPRRLLAALLAPTRPAAAWEQVELSLARGSLDEQARRRESALSPAEAAERDDLKRAHAATQAQILIVVSKQNPTAEEGATLERRLADRRAVGERLSGLAVAQSTRLVATPEAIRAALPAGAALLHWVDVVDKSGSVQEHWACVVRQEGEPKCVQLPGTSQNRKWTKGDDGLPYRVRQGLQSKAPPPDLADAIEKLRAQRIASVLPHLEGVTTLYVVGVEEMAGVPVELLAPQFTITYVPSGTFLARLKDRPVLNSDRLLALGDPVFPSVDKKSSAESPLPPGGLLVSAVTPGGNAAKAGIEPNDVLLKYDGTVLKSVEELGALVQRQVGERSIPSIVWRDGKELTRTLSPGKLGVALAKEPAPAALAARREGERLMARLSRGGEWAELPGTAVEVDNLRQLLPDRTAVLTRSEASEQRLEQLRKAGDLAKYRYLHFATHGEANDVKAFESALILAQDKLPKELESQPGEPFLNGQLSAREVLDHWTLDAELVTLSACETALGRKGGGDGLLGFAQAFLTAGARSVCLSLWKVDDQATALLMDRFYRNLLGKRDGLAKPMGKAVALAEAKKWLREMSEEEATKSFAKLSGGVDRAKGKTGLSERIAPAVVDGVKRPFADPRYWAAFILFGDPD